MYKQTVREEPWDVHTSASSPCLQHHSPGRLPEVRKVTFSQIEHLSL